MKTINLGAGLLALLALGLAVWQSIRVHDLQAAASAANSELRTRIEKLETQLAQVEARKSAAVFVGSTNPANPEEQRDQERLAEQRRYQQELARRRAREARELGQLRTRSVFTPEVQQIHFRNYELELPVRYRSLIRALGLSSEQTAQFEKLLAERYWAYSDLMATRIEQGSAFDERTFTEMKERSQASFESGLRALAGEAGVEQYRQFARAAHVQNLIQAVAGRLYDTSEPLSAAQADELVGVLVAHNFRQDEPASEEAWLQAQITGQSPPRTDGQWTDIDWRTAESEMAHILSASQAAVVQGLREQAESRLRVQVLQEDMVDELRKRQEAEPPIPPPAP